MEQTTRVEKHLMQAGIHAVKKGGAVLMNSFGKIQDISYKGTIDLVTETDRRSEDAVVDFLCREFPEHGILTEEREERITGSSTRWILDPLDGTTNYAHSYPFFAVSLALEKKGRVVWGAVYDPLRDELFSAELGGGANVNGHPIRVSAAADLEKSMLCTGFPYDVHHSEKNNIKNFISFIKVARAIRRDGSAALDLCYVAMGRFDGYWEMKLKPWDVAAGCLVVTEAGGRVTAFDGAPLDMLRGEVLASNGVIHDNMIRILAGNKDGVA